MKKLLRVLGGAVLLVLVASLAQAGVAGEYRARTAGFKGTLVIKDRPHGAIHYNLRALTEGEHLAVIEGVTALDGRVAVIKGKQGCRIKVRFADKKAVISGGNSSCRPYLGAASVMDGIYYKVSTKKPTRGKKAPR